jgi:ribose-phosphate pyrophosphokinase
MEAGAISVDAYITHGVLSGAAVARVTASPLTSLVTTDSIEATEAVLAAHNIRQISVASLLGEAVSRINEERSVSSLFN